MAPPALNWLQDNDPFPDPASAWGEGSPAPGLLAAGADLQPARLRAAYAQGIFPWFSTGQPILWWSPHPRMVLRPEAFRMRRSLQQSLRQWLARPDTALVFDRDFDQVIEACASSPRTGQSGTWIVPDMVRAYRALHAQGIAHSAELWSGSQLQAGLYFVALGGAVFGESMFTRVRDGSKMALALLVSVARHHGLPFIDCQQNTRHLASLGAAPIDRAQFLSEVRGQVQQAPIDWARENLYWDNLLAPKT